MKRGITLRRQTAQGQRLERVLITRRYELAHARPSCLGCGLCVAVCPQKAIELQPAQVADGRLISRAAPVLSAERCNFCGACVVVCLSHSLRLLIDGTPRLPVVESGAFPMLLADVRVDVGRCRPDCGLACEKECPTRAIAVAVAADGQVARIAEVAVDRDRCYYCGRCQVACPAGAIAVHKPIEGGLRLAAALCPAGCQVCADACPTGAIRVAAAGPNGGDDRLVAPAQTPLAVDERSCCFCGACQQACPVENALTVQRNRVCHGEVKSAAWTTALGNILSAQAQARELEAKARRRARQAAAGLLGIG